MKVAILLLSVVVLSQAESWVAAPYTLVKRGTTLAINVVDIYLLLIYTVLYYINAMTMMPSLCSNLISA